MESFTFVRVFVSFLVLFSVFFFKISSFIIFKKLKSIADKHRNFGIFSGFS